MVRTQNKIRFAIVSAFFSLLFVGTAFGQYDPPTRVLRLNYTNGNVSAQPAGVDEWGPAPVNRPFSIGDYLYTDQSSVAELVTDVGRIRMGQYTNFGVLNLTDTVLQLKLTEGDMYFRVHDFGPDQVFEVDTPNAAITLLRPGNYRIHVDPNQNTSLVVVRRGQAEVTGGGQQFTLDSGNSATLSGTDQLAYDVEGAPNPDQFDDWAAGRDQRYERARPQYVPTSMVGYEDLADNGQWSDVPQYGHVWYPRSVPSGWAPYHNGHWAWVEPWGWTWVDDASWGFAPFHYGRWVYNEDRWGWTPGPEAAGYGGYDSYDGYGGYGGRIARPCYAPALVAWFGGAHFGIGLSLGGGEPNVGWVPLGYGEVYTPSYQVSQNYFRNVNVSNTRIVNTTNITNVYNNVYVNKTAYNTTYVNAAAPNAVVAMPQNSFANGASVAQRAVALQPRQVAQLRSAQPVVLAPQVAPTRQATLNTLGANTVRPPAQLVQRQVVARTAPPPPPAAFQARQAFLQQHAGQPVNVAAMRQAVAPQQAQARPAVTVVQAPAARPRVVQPGTRVGNVPTAAVNNRAVGNAGQAPQAQPQQFSRPAQGAAPAQNPGNRPGQSPVQAPAYRPGQPAAVAPQSAAPPPAMHGVPPNQRQSVAPQAAPQPVPAPRGAPPAVTQSNRPAPVQQPRAVEPSAAPVPPAAHGVPPNQRQNAPPQAEPAPRATPAPVPQQREVQPQARPQQAPPPSYSRPEPQRTAPVPPPQQREVQPQARPQQAPPPPSYSRPEPQRTAPVPPPQQREVQPQARPQQAPPPPSYSRPEPQRTAPVPPPQQREVQPQARPQQPPPSYARPEPQQREVQPPRQAPPPPREAQPAPREAPPAHGTPPNQRENPRDTKPDHP